MKTLLNLFSSIGVHVLLLGNAQFEARAAEPMAALAFDGKNNFVEIPSRPMLGTRYTEEAWILPNPKDADYHGILGFSYNQSATRAPGIWIHGTALHSGFGTGAKWISVDSPANAITLNVWNHVAATYDGTTYRIFANGSEVVNQAISEIPLQQPVMCIGRVEHFFPGAIREVRLWNRALTGDEIRGHMSKVLSGSEEGLVAYFRFNDGTGLEAKNSVPQGGNGKLMKGPKWITSSAPIAPELLKAQLLDAGPGSIQDFLPTGENAAPDSPIEITFRETAGKVNPKSIRLSVDEINVAITMTTNDLGALLIRSEEVRLFEPASTHSVKVSYVIGAMPGKTNDFSYDFSVSANILLSK